MSRTGPKMIDFNGDLSDDEFSPLIIEKIYEIENSSDADMPQFYIEDIEYPIDKFPFSQNVYPLVNLANKPINVINDSKKKIDQESWPKPVTTNGHISIENYPQWKVKSEPMEIENESEVKNVPLNMLLEIKPEPGLSREQRKLIPIAIIDAKPKCKKEMSDKLKMIIDASEQENISCDKLEKIPVTIVGMRQSINGEKERKHSLARKQTNFIIRRCLNLPLFIYCSHYEMSKERSVTNFTVLFTSFSNKIQQRSIKVSSIN